MTKLPTLSLLVFTLIAALRGATLPLALPLQLPREGDAGIQLLTPTILELTVVTAPKRGESPTDPAGQITSADFELKLDDTVVPAEITGFKRRVLYAPLRHRDLRVRTQVYLRLPRPVSESPPQAITLTLRQKAPGLSGPLTLATSANPRRTSPALHVNQEGYTVGFPKSAFAGYFVGTGGELELPSEAQFELVDQLTGETAYTGLLLPRREVGFNGVRRPYQNVYEADFSKFDRPGTYRLFVRGLGASLPFRIGEGELMGAVRAYALGLYHQRCGVANSLPFTRFTHGPCHVSEASIPLPAADFPKAWKIIGDLHKDNVKPEHPEQQLRHVDNQLYPYARRGRIDVSHGHHDAGDYSKYVINSTGMLHALMFAVDSLPGVAELDNLGVPESSDGVGDILQEAKWEADYVARMQDDDGGFYFLVYPRDRRYENDVTPDRGDPQIVWPKNTAATAAAVAALAQCAGSPAFKRQYPDAAKEYLTKARKGWKFLLAAVDQHGRHAYQRLTHYGDTFEDRDELAWAACELFVATGDLGYEKKLFEWYPNPSDPKTMQWAWRRASFAYGNALRSYAFAARSGRLPRNKLDAGYLAKCELELRRAGDDAMRASEQNAYGASFPEPSKRIMKAGWFFPSDEAFDITVAHRLQPKPRHAAAVLANLNYELGCNPVNQTFITGLGQNRQREIVHQYAQADDRTLPPSGIPIGAIQSDFAYVDQYKTQLVEQSWPKDDARDLPYALYDRWSDVYNFNTEFVVINQARSLASLAYWAAQTPLKEQKWKSGTARIVGASATLPLYQPVTFTLESTDVDLTEARIVWEARGQEPSFGPSYTITPRTSGRQWVEAEAALPDGRRVFARAEFNADAPIVLWVNGRLPEGASAYAEHGDAWEWLQPDGRPSGLAAGADALQHESALAAGIHHHGFTDATETMHVGQGDILFAYVKVDPKHPPRTIMLEWNDGSNEHRAFWGENHIPYGKMNTNSQRPMGPLPAFGKWVRLEVPARAVGLENRTVTGMTFRLHSGRARWAAAGKLSAAAAAAKNK